MFQECECLAGDNTKKAASIEEQSCLGAMIFYRLVSGSLRHLIKQFEFKHDPSSLALFLFRTFHDCQHPLLHVLLSHWSHCFPWHLYLQRKCCLEFVEFGKKRGSSTIYTK